ncbi:MAG: oligosaccharide flippase family protein [bacterium]|nr:oligosaccharide flippase family protein [bacterium]
MRFSKFLKDIFLTGFSQVIVLLLGVLLLKVIAKALDVADFGLFMVVRRWISTFVPFLVLGLGLSLTRSISFDRQKERHYVKVSTSLITGIFILFGILVLFRAETVSLLIFNTTETTLLTHLLPLIVYTGGVYTLVYSVFRGRQQMIAANAIQVAYFSLPLIPALILLALKIEDGYQVIYLFYIFSTIPVIAVLLTYLIKEKSFNLLYPFKFKLKELGTFLSYGLSRTPASLLMSLVLLIPVDWSNRNLSFEAAAYVGITVTMIRLMEIFSAPFNKIFVPKFSEFKGDSRNEEIKEKSGIVLNFIFSFFPVVVVLTYGLAEHIVVFFYGDKYAAAVPSVQVIILFSFFYISYTLIKGILNGVFVFPFETVICGAGAGVTALAIHIFKVETLAQLTMGFGVGIMALGLTSFAVFMISLKINFPFKTLAIYGSLCAALFFSTLFVDKVIKDLTSADFTLQLIVLIAFRLALVAGIFFLLWQKTLWYKELRKRMNIKK